MKNKVRNKIGATIFGSLLSIASAIPAFSQVSILKNGSFEEYATSGIPNSWSRTYVSPSGSSTQSANATDPVRCGGYSLKIVDGSATSSEGVSSDMVPIIPGATYTAESYILRTNPSNAACLFLTYYDANKAPVRSASIVATGTLNAWNYTSLSSRSPANAAYACVLCYSAVASTGTMYFDGVSLAQSSSNGVPNPDMSQDAIGSAYPINWEKWPGGSEPVSVATDPTNSANKVMKLADASTQGSASSMTRIPVVANMQYTVSARMYYASGSAPLLFVKYIDKNGNILDSASVVDSSLGQWVTQKITRTAPPGTIECQISAYSTVSGTGTSYFDDFAITANYITYYVSPDGTGDGSSPSTPAKYNYLTFWQLVQAQLALQSVKIIFAEGNYIINNVPEDMLHLTGIGTETNALILSGAHPYGTIFNRTLHNGDRVSITGFQNDKNMTLQNLHWEDHGVVSGTSTYTGDSLYINTTGTSSSEVSKNIVVEGCSFVGLANNFYSAMHISGLNTHDITVRNCEFVRNGVDDRCHMIYSSDYAYNINVSNNYFQDCTGDYVRFRNDCHDGFVLGNMFVATCSKTSVSFIQQVTINDASTDNEILGHNFTYSNNTFNYFVNTNGDTAIQFFHSGYDPTTNGVTWPYLLTAADGAILDSGGLADRKAFMKQHYDLDFDSNITIGNNIRVGHHVAKIRLTTNTAYGAINPSPNGDGNYDISDLGKD